MNENNVRALLHDLADRPEPAPRIDIDRARRRGLRRLWARRAALSAGVATVVALSVVIPRAVNSAVAPGRAGVNPAATSKAVKPTPTTTSGYLNPLVPSAAFGYLPKGYALDVTPSAIRDGFLSTVDNLTITAAQVAGDYYIQLSVMPKNGCSGLLGGIPGWSATLAEINRCSTLTGQDSGRAPDVNGRIAYWGNGGLDLAWQYAPGSWAVLRAQSGGNDMFPYVQAATLLPRMAASVKFGQAKAIVFPFKLSGAVPADWHPVSATYTVSAAGEYLANELDVAPYADYEAHGVTGLIVDAGKTADVNGNTCGGQSAGTPTGTTSSLFLQADAVWLVRTPIGATGKKPAQGPGQSDSDATACTQGPDHGLYLFADLKLDTTGAPPGGISAVLTHLSVLGVDPASWTATPLAG
jgi:hypothetical protein